MRIAWSLFHLRKTEQSRPESENRSNLQTVSLLTYDDADETYIFVGSSPPSFDNTFRCQQGRGSSRDIDPGADDVNDLEQHRTAW